MKTFSRRVMSKRVVVLVAVVLALTALAVIIGTKRASAAALTVTNTNDSGAGSLRDAISLANTNPGPDTISFAAGVMGTILLTSGQLTITDVTGELTINGPGAGVLTVSGNLASRVFLVSSGVSAAITGLTISDGRASGSSGGGIFNNGGTLTITSSTISGNSAGSSGGGGIGNFGTLTITSSTISGNSATSFGLGGGGIFNSIDGTVTITNSTISGNSADVSGGITNDGTMTINNSTISDNSARFSGAGGVLNSILGMLMISNSTISGNSAKFGNGGGIFNSFVGTVTITNSTISGNSAGGSGGAIFNLINGTVTINNSTISGNSAGIGNGGGIFNSDTVNIKNSIVANSLAGGDCAGTGTFNASGVNFSTDGTCPGFTVVPSTGPGGLNLGPLANNGGPTLTHALLPGSVAIDAVTDCTDLSGNPVTTDQRGVPRPKDGNGDGTALCDAGSFEATGAFNVCLQDDYSGNLLLINTTTGEYEFTNCQGVALSGTGTITRLGEVVFLQHFAGDRIVNASLGAYPNSGSATITSWSLGRSFSITDSNITNNTCGCQ